MAKKILALLLVCTLLGVLIWQITAIVPLKARVEAEMNTTPSPTPPWGNVQNVTPDPAATAKPMLLKTGSFGDKVAELQKKLSELGYYSGEIDGKFGLGTKEAVGAFQRRNNLTDDGIVGEETMSVLYSENAVAAEK